MRMLETMRMMVLNSLIRNFWGVACLHILLVSLEVSEFLWVAKVLDLQPSLLVLFWIHSSESTLVGVAFPITSLD